jgi:small subunit ribosomal protein S6
VDRILQRTTPAAIPRKGGVTMPLYEMILIIQPELEEEPLNAGLERISQTIADLGGEVLKTEPWGRRRMAYPIKGYREGLYFLMDLNLPSPAVRGLGRSLKLMEDVIRHLIVSKDNKESK